MFHKPFKIKSKTSIKGSDRKKLRAQLMNQFCDLTAETARELVPNKREMTTMKIRTHADLNITVYCLERNPMFFDFESCIYPTVYSLWLAPRLTTVFTTWPAVFAKMAGGANLMLPGVVTKGDPSIASLGNVVKNELCAVNLVGNLAPIAVGHAAMSSGDMLAAGMCGKGVIIDHICGDHLWLEGDKSKPPVISDDAEMGDDPNDRKQETTHTAQTGDAVDTLTTGVDDLHSLTLEDAGEKDGEDETTRQDGAANVDTSTQDSQDQMDELLLRCFLCALKTRIKAADLPMLTSKLLHAYIQPCCASGESLDVRRTSHKKLSVFLSEMRSRGVVDVAETSKGVDSLTAIHRQHALLKDFVLPQTDVEDTKETAVLPSSGQCVAAQIQEVLTVTAATLPLFKLYKYSKGSALSEKEVRQVLTDYARTNELHNGRHVKLDPLLADVLSSRGEYITSLSWEEATARCVAKMAAAHRLASGQQRGAVRKGAVQPVIVDVVQRASSKKVTLVRNLEMFEIDADEFAHKVQVGVACSASVNPLPGKGHGVEVMVQGNQVNYIGRLLTETYKLPKKYIRGLDKAPKSGRKP